MILKTIRRSSTIAFGAACFGVLLLQTQYAEGEEATKVEESAARGDADNMESVEPEVSHDPGVLSGITAFVPGAAIHGFGIWMSGDRRTAYRLLALEGVGLAMVTGGILPMILTHASGQNLDISVALIAAGVGLLYATAMAGFYGGTVGARDTGPPRYTPNLEPFVGYGFIHDPQFDYHNFAVLRLDARVGRMRFSPRAWLALDDDNQQIGLDIAFRIAGPRPKVKVEDGSYVDFQTGLTYHRFGTENFTILTTEFLFPMRLDLKKIGPSLDGSFVDFDLGWAFQFFEYGAADLALGSDISSMILLRFGFGVYLGKSQGRRGEVALFYDHRHDGFAGGLAADLHEPNFFGHVGIEAKMHFQKGWGLEMSVGMGSALVTMIGVNYEFGGKP